MTANFIGILVSFLILSNSAFYAIGEQADDSSGYELDINPMDVRVETVMTIHADDVSIGVERELFNAEFGTRSNAPAGVVMAFLPDPFTFGVRARANF